MLQAVSGTLHHLLLAGGIRHHPDLVGVCLDMYSVLMRKKAPFLCEAPNIPISPENNVPFFEHVGKLVNHGLYFAEQPVVKAAVSFITETARQNVQIIQDLVAHFGQLWVIALLEVFYYSKTIHFKIILYYFLLIVIVSGYNR